MFNGFKNKSITFVSMTLFFIFTILVFLIIFAFFQTKLVDITTENKYEQNTIDAYNIKNYLESSFESNENLLMSASHYLSDYQTLSNQEIELFLNDIFERDHYLLSFEIVNEDYIVDYTYPNTRDTLGFNREYQLTEINLDEDDFYWSKPTKSPDEDEAYMSLIIKKSNYYYIGNFSLYFIDEIYQNIEEKNEYKNILIHDGYGIFVYDSLEDRELHRIKCPNYETFKSIYDNNLDIKTMVIAGEEEIITVEYLEVEDWYITITESTQSIYPLFMAITAVILLLFGLLVILYFVTILSINHFIRRNLNLVKENILNVSSGNYNSRIDEYVFKDFEPITTSFNEMNVSLRETRNRLENLAYYDQLTSLHSRNFVDTIFQELKAKFSNILFLYIDIQRFKLINDLYGYEFANRIMVEIAERLRNLPIKDLYPLRSEGDAFILLINADDLESHTESTVSYIISSLHRPYSIDLSDVEIKVNIGASLYPKDGNDSQVLVNNCLFALQDAKKNQMSNYEYFDNSRREEFKRSIDIEVALDKAFQDEEFYPVFQPLITAKTKEIRGFEVLSRWTNTDLGFISPGEFIPILEQNHKIAQLDKLVLSKAIEKAQILKENFDKDFVVSINVSVETIVLDDYVKFVKKVLKQTNYDPNFLELEVTESTIISDFDLVSSRINELKGLGIRFAEDDFGDGFSALNYLASLNLDTVKISINITKTLLTNEKNKILLGFIVDLAKKFNFETVIEGIEDEETAKICTDYGCTYLQGYYFYKPMKFEDLYKEVKKINSRKQK